MRRWENNIKMDVTEIWWEGADEPSGFGRASVEVCCECGNELPGSSVGILKCNEYAQAVASEEELCYVVSLGTMKTN
jgi:hypothetical protein